MVSLEQFHRRILRAPKLGQGLFWGVLAHCSKGRDEPHLSYTANLRSPPLYTSKLLQWQKAYRLGEDELHRPLVVALRLFLHLCCKMKQKSDPPFAHFPWKLYCRPSFRNLYDTFLTKWPKMSNYVYMWKVTSGGRAEIQNGRICNLLHILNFSSATWSKSIIQIFERWSSSWVI